MHRHTKKVSSHYISLGVCKRYRIPCCLYTRTNQIRHRCTEVLFLLSLFSCCNICIGNTDGEKEDREKRDLEDVLNRLLSMLTLNEDAVSSNTTNAAQRDDDILISLLGEKLKERMREDVMQRTVSNEEREKTEEREKEEEIQTSKWLLGDENKSEGGGREATLFSEIEGSPALERNLEKAAVRIQAVYRGHSARKRYKSRLERREEAARKIQKVYRKRYKKKAKAAQVIQDAFRVHQRQHPSTQQQQSQRKEQGTQITEDEGNT